MRFIVFAYACLFISKAMALVATECTSSRSFSAYIKMEAQSFVSPTDGVIENSQYRAGDIVRSSRPILTFKSWQQTREDSDLRGKISELELRFFEEKNKVKVTEATLDDYIQRNGPLTQDTRDRILRKHEIKAMLANLNQMKKALIVSETNSQQINGVFPFDVLLISNPPRKSFAIKSGSVLFNFVPLDRVTIATQDKAIKIDSSKPIYMVLGGRCIDVHYALTTVDYVSNVKLSIFHVDIPNGYREKLASVMRSSEMDVILVQ